MNGNTAQNEILSQEKKNPISNCIISEIEKQHLLTQQNNEDYSAAN